MPTCNSYQAHFTLYFLTIIQLTVCNLLNKPASTGTRKHLYYINRYPNALRDSYNWVEITKLTQLVVCWQCLFTQVNWRWSCKSTSLPEANSVHIGYSFISLAGSSRGRLNYQWQISDFSNSQDQLISLKILRKDSVYMSNS